MNNASAGYRQYARDVSRQFLVLAVGLPLAAAVVAIAMQSVQALNLVHVVSGAAWGGATLYIAGVLSPTLMGLEPPQRAAVTVPLIPKHILLYSALAATTLATGTVLTEVAGRDHSAPIMIAAYVAGFTLLVLAAYLVRTQGKIYDEVHGGEPDMARVGSLAATLGTVGRATAVVMVATLVVMALLRTG